MERFSKMKITNPLLLTFLICFLLGCDKQQAIQDDLFVFEADERLFTAHAFMNVGGFDLEYNPEGMTQIRSEIRNSLKEKLDKVYQDSIRDYYSRHEKYLGSYGIYALIITGPPDFEINYDANTSDNYVNDYIHELPDLNEWLRDFHYKADIHVLWKKYTLLIQKKIDEHRPYAQKALEDLVSYFRTDEIDFKQIDRRLYTHYSPLMSYFNAFTVRINNDIHFVFGPQKGNPSESSYYHEAMHHIVNPLTEKYIKHVNEYSELLSLAQEQLKGNYNDWELVVNESFVRTISKVLTGKLSDKSKNEVLEWVFDEYKRGYILSMYLFENLPNYEMNNEPMKTYYPKLISGIDIEFEKKRWRKFGEDNSE